MAGFTTYADITTALNSGKGQRPQYSKPTATLVASAWFSLWNLGGTGAAPIAGTFGTALTARQITNGSTGAVQFTNAASGSQMHLISLGMGSTAGAGVLVLVDRLLEAPFDGTVTAGVFNSGSPLVIPPRDVNGSPSGQGLFMFVENVSVTTATAANITVIYTNSQGVTGQTTGVQPTFSSATHRIITSNQNSPQVGGWLPLASGDTGVQAISGYTLSASITSTQLNIVVCRVLAHIPILTANTFIERDMVLQTANLPRLYDGTALQFLVLAAGTSLGTLTGNITFAEN